MQIASGILLFSVSGALIYLARYIFGANSLAGATLASAVEAAKGVLLLKLRGYCAEAEKTGGGGTGQWKLAAVLEKVTESAWYSALPNEVKRELNAEELAALIDKTVKDWLTPQLEKNAKLRALIIQD